MGANGGKVTFGFQGIKGSSPATVPTYFAVNGVACSDVIPPTATSVPPTATNVPPTVTNVPPTVTTVPPTATNIPPTATTIPPTVTTVPPTATSIPPTQPPGGSCSVDYTIANQWGTGFQANVTIKNHATTAVSGYTLTWNFTAGQQFSSGWNATFSQNGTAVSASNPANNWNGTIAPNGGVVSFGFQGTYNVNNPKPTNFALNGKACTGGPTPTPIPPTSTPGPSPTPAPAAIFRVNTQGRITKDGQVLPVQCGSWFGLEGRHEPSSDPTNPGGAAMELYVGNTSWVNGGQGSGRTIQQTMDEITAMGINVVRLPVAPQTLNPTDPQGMAPNLKNHTSVRVPTARQALEEFLVLADQNNIEVMLDMHSCSNYVGWRAGRLDARPPYADWDRDQYDYYREDSSCAATLNPPGVTRIQAYDETKWLNDLRTLAGLGTQLGVDNIIGIDIFNEPWDYTWEDWKTFTEHAYAAINEVNPNTLLFVQGISATANNQDGTPNTITQVPHGDEATNPNWGENLFEAGANPPNVPKERLVYSPHTYGPSVFVQKGFMDPAQPQCAGLEGDAAGDADCNIVINVPQLRSGWEEHFGYLKDQGYAIVVGEFGGNLDWPRGQASLRDQTRWSHITPGVDQIWQDAFVDYMVDKGIEGCYWSINPESGDTGGWYGHAYDPISNTSGWGEWRDFDARKTSLLFELWGK
ncbi:MAG: cellulase family glycosylhydrolase [Anaerolineae bacterium]|nr:cellulase family glycosylhydrolase [Anaerolineae bacterium]